MKQIAPPIRVFISYSRDSKTHKNRVLSLSNRLREDGIDCWLDQYEVSPPEGWPEWCRREIQEADYVLVVCTNTYKNRFERKAPDGEDAGVKWEGFILTQELYDNEGKNKRFIPVVFTKEDRKHIPGLLKGATHYVLNDEKGYEALLRHLTNQPSIIPPKPGPIKVLPPEPRPVYDLLDTPEMKYIGKNLQGFDEFRWVKDDSIMIKIPAGKFWMGSGRDEGFDDEYPQHQVYLDEFYIDKYEVTNEQFACFIEATGYRTDAERFGTPVKWRDFYDARTGNHPVVFVSWNDAVAYCNWVGKHLPTEAEWEKAARGCDCRNYPWGDQDPDDTRANFKLTDRRTKPVGSYPQGASPYGCLDMAGNVWEWCADWYDMTYYARSPDRNPQVPPSGLYRVNRGGSWGMLPYYLRSAARGNRDAQGHASCVGFRCAFNGG